MVESNQVISFRGRNLEHYNTLINPVFDWEAQDGTFD